VSEISFLTLFSLFRFPRTFLQCQQCNRPLPSNEGCRPPFNIVEGSSSGAEGYGNARGDPCCGRPVRCVRSRDHNPHISFHPTTTQLIQHRRGKPNIDAATPTTTQQAQCQRGKPNIDAASPMSTRQARHRHGKPNVDAASPTLTRQAQHRCGKPDIDTASLVSTQQDQH